MLLISVILIIWFIISVGDNGDLGALYGLFFLGGIISLINLLTFFIYEFSHRNLDQILLLKLNLIYRQIIFLAILTHIIWAILFIIFKSLQGLPYAFVVFIWAIPYFLVLWFLRFHKNIIVGDVIRGHNFNILATLLVIASVIFCVIISTQFSDMANFKAVRFERILKTTFAENDLDKCIKLRENEAICVTYFAVGLNDESFCEKRSDPGFIKYCKKEVAKARNKK